MFFDATNDLQYLDTKSPIFTISRYFVSDTLTPIKLDIYQPLTTQMEAFNVNIKKNKDIEYILILCMY